MPAAPTSLAASPLDSQAALTWDDPSDSTITGYSVRSSTSLPVGGTWTAISGSGATTTSHTVASLTNGTRYYFQIRATNANGDSDASDTATIGLAASPSTTVTIPDSDLRTALEMATGKAVGVPITQLDMAKLTSLEVWSGVSNASGLEHAVNMQVLGLAGTVSDLSPLASLTALRDLDLAFNSISDVTPLAGLTSLTSLILQYNAISDVTPLASLTSLTNLQLSDNSISDPSPLATLTSLINFSLDSNPISRFSDVPLASFSSSLIGIGLSGAWISDSLLARFVVDYPDLRFLTLDGGSIRDLTVLNNLTRIVSLSLRDNSISDANSLARLTAPLSPIVAA